MSAEVGSNTRDLAQILRHLQDVRGALAERDHSRSNDIGAIHHLATQITVLEGKVTASSEAIDELQARMDRLIEIVVTGNGQKALAAVISEHGVHLSSLRDDIEDCQNGINMLRQRTRKEVTIPDAALAKARWHALGPILKYSAPALVAFAGDALAHLIGLFHH